MADLTDAAQAVRARGVELLRAASAQVGGETVTSSPVDTGLMRARHGVTSVVFAGDVATCVIEADTPYAEHVAYGTRPHEIRPRNGRVLRFVQGGRVRFARVVQHPGTRPRPEWWSVETLRARFSRALEGLTS